MPVVKFLACLDFGQPGVLKQQQLFIVLPLSFDRRVERQLKVKPDLEEKVS